MTLFKRLANIWWLGGQVTGTKDIRLVADSMRALLRGNQLTFVDTEEHNVLTDPLVKS